MRSWIFACIALATLLLPPIALLNCHPASRTPTGHIASLSGLVETVCHWPGHESNINNKHIYLSGNINHSTLRQLGNIIDKCNSLLRRPCLKLFFSLNIVYNSFFQTKYSMPARPILSISEVKEKCGKMFLDELKNLILIPFYTFIN